MLIHTKENCRVSEDGFAVRALERNQVYDLADNAARSLIRDGKAAMVQADSIMAGMERIKALSDDILQDHEGLVSNHAD